MPGRPRFNSDRFAGSSMSSLICDSPKRTNQTAAEPPRVAIPLKMSKAGRLCGPYSAGSMDWVFHGERRSSRAEEGPIVTRQHSSAAEGPPGLLINRLMRDLSGSVPIRSEQGGRSAQRFRCHT